MPSLLTTLTTGLACLAGTAAAAGDIEVRLLRGVCYPYAGSFPTNTGNAYVGELELRPKGTGTFLDELPARWSSITEQQRGIQQWHTMALMNTTGYAYSRIACQDEDGLILPGNPTQYVRINTDRDATLVYDSYGLIPEPYAHYVNGTRQPGVYLGLAGETRWAWTDKRRGATTPAALGLWTPRLRVATDGNPRGGELREGEVAGYLWAQ